MARRRTAAQKAATRKLVALNRARARGRSTTRRRRRRNPVGQTVARRRRVSSGPVATYVTNPRRRYRRRRPSTRRRSYRRRNPARRMTLRSIMNQQIIPAAIGGTGAIGLDFLYGQVKGFLPLQLQTDPWQNFAKAGVAILGGMVAGMVVRPATAHQLTQGALTVVMRDAIMGFIPAETKANLGLGEYMEPGMQMGYYSPGYVASPQTDATLGYSNYGDQLTPMGEYMTDMMGQEM